MFQLPSVVVSFVVAQATDTPLHRAEPVAWARLLAALILLTMGGVAFVVLAWLTLRVGRRHLRREDASLKRGRDSLRPDDWASRPLISSEQTKPEQSRD